MHKAKTQVSSVVQALDHAAAVHDNAGITQAYITAIRNREVTNTIAITGFLTRLYFTQAANVKVIFEESLAELASWLNPELALTVSQADVDDLKTKVIIDDNLPYAKVVRHLKAACLLHRFNSLPVGERGIDALVAIEQALNYIPVQPQCADYLEAAWDKLGGQHSAALIAGCAQAFINNRRLTLELVMQQSKRNPFVDREVQWYVACKLALHPHCSKPSRDEAKSFLTLSSIAEQQKAPASRDNSLIMIIQFYLQLIVENEDKTTYFDSDLFLLEKSAQLLTKACYNRIKSAIEKTPVVANLKLRNGTPRCVHKRDEVPEESRLAHSPSFFSANRLESQKGQFVDEAMAESSLSGVQQALLL